MVLWVGKLDHCHDTLGSGSGVGDAEDDGSARSDSFNGLYDLFQVGRGVVAATLDDDLLQPPGDVQLSCLVDHPFIAGAEPPSPLSLQNNLCGRLRIPKIAVHETWSRNDDLAQAPHRKSAAFRVHDMNFEALKRPAYGYPLLAT